MKLFSRLFGTWLLLACASVVWAQPTGPKIVRVDVKFVGPASVSEQFVRANLRLKAGDAYFPGATEDDIHSLYGTGQFYNIRATADAAEGGVALTYTVQARLRLTDIKLEGNKQLSDSKIRKKLTVKVGQPIDEQKLFTDGREIQKLYEKYGYAGSRVKYVLNMDEPAGRGSVTFVITEAARIKIQAIDFVGAAAYTQKELRGQIKTKRHWMWSWLTGNGVFKEDDFEDDRDVLTDFYHGHGYLDFEIRNVRFDHPTTNTMVIRYFIYEGRQYHVGTVTLSGDKLFTPEEIRRGLGAVHSFERSKGRLGPHGLAMDTGDIFTPEGLNRDTSAIQDFYGSKGYIDVVQGPTLRAAYIPNVETGTMDLEFQIKEGQKSQVEKIGIRGNEKTKDKVIRRELAISPGEVFDMVRVKISKQRLEGLQYFSKVDLRPEPTDPPITGRKDLIVNVEEQNTGNLMLGAGFSSVDSLVGYAEISQGNADLFHPPNFTGAGQKLRLFIQLGTERQDYMLSFVEPWFLNRKLALGVDLYQHQLNFESPNDIYEETRTGMRLSLTRALWSDFFIGSVSYTLENINIRLVPPYHGNLGNPPDPVILANTPQAILDQVGNHLYNRFGFTLAYDTRNSTQLPNHGQRTELDPEFSAGDTSFYKLELKSAWYFPGLFTGHVIEAVGRAGVAESVSGGDVPFYDRFYLGGLYSLRGFKFRNVAPRDPSYGPHGTGSNPNMPNEPIGGDTFWFGSVEYSIPIFEKENGGPGVRFAMFYDVGAVYEDAWSTSGANFDDDWGLGLHINIPHLGPLRLEYGIPIHHDEFNGGGGRFQFGVGWQRPF